MPRCTPTDLADAAIELPIITSFSRIGPALRRRLDDWRPLDSYDLSAKTVLVTGATSGLGRHTALRLAGLGARVILNGRSASKTEQVRDELTSASGRGRFEIAIADIGELDQVTRLAGRVAELTDTLHAVVHNAGSLTAQRQNNSADIEATVASQVLGPFALTAMLLPQLSAAAPGRVITVASGGMYAAGLSVSNLQLDADRYRGSDQYARAKRAQVTLNEMWATQVAPHDVVFHAMHPGWADTPGVRHSLPRFRAVMRPLLRNVEQGADTIVWLVADDVATESSGKFWLDRRVRPIHKLPGTKRSDTPAQRAELWEWCVAHSGVRR